LSCIYNNDTEEHECIFTEGTDGEEADAELLRGRDAGDFAAGLAAER